MAQPWGARARSPSSVDSPYGAGTPQAAWPGPGGLGFEHLNNHCGATKNHGAIGRSGLEVAYKRRPVPSELSLFERDEFLENSFVEVEGGGFLAAWSPPDAVKAAIQDAFKAKGKYQSRLTQQRFHKLSRERRRAFVRAFVLEPCLNQMVAGLGPTSAEPLVSELWAVADETLKEYPAPIVRLVLLDALLNEATTSPGVIEYVAMSHPALRVAADPQLDEPLFDRLDHVEGDSLVPPVTARALDQEEPGSLVPPNTSPESSLADAVESARLAALHAARSALLRIEEGRLPHTDDLSLVATYRKRFTAFADEVSDLCGHPSLGDVTLARLRLLFDQARTRHFLFLAELGTARSEKPIDCLDEAIAEALRLADITGSPSEDDRSLAEGLSLVLEALRNPRSQAPSLENAIGRLLPSRWLKLVHGIEFGLVYLPQAAGSMGHVSDPQPLAPLPPGATADDEAVSEAVDDWVLPERVENELEVPQGGARVSSEEPAMTPAEAKALVGGSLPAQVPQNLGPDVDQPSEVGPAVLVVEQEARGGSEATLGQEFLSSGRLSPYYWWVSEVASPDEGADSFSSEVALSAVLLDGARSSLDEFAYKASDALMSSVSGMLKPGHADHAVAAALALAGAAGTGHDGFRVALLQLEAQPNLWSDQTRSTMRQLSETPLGGIVSGRPSTNSDQSISTVLSAVELEAEWAREFCDVARHRRIRYQPATVVWQELVRPDGPHGVLAEAADVIARGDVSGQARVRQLVDQLRSRPDVQALIDRVSRSTPRLHSQTTIVAGARQRLLESIEEAVEHFDRWLMAISQAELAESRGNRPSSASTVSAAELDAALAELLRPIGSRPQLHAEVLRIAQHSIKLGSTPTLAQRPEDPIEQWIGWQLDVDATIPSDAQFRADRSLLTRRQLLSPDAESIRSNCEQLLEHGELARVEAVSSAIECLHPEIANELKPLVTQARAARLKELWGRCDYIETLLGQARAFGLISDENASDVLTDLEIVRLDDGRSVQALSAQLEGRASDLRARLAERGDQLRSRVSELADAGVLDAARRQNLLNRLDADDLRTVEEQLARIDEGGDLGSASEGLIDVRDFFPSKVQAASSLKPDWSIYQAVLDGTAIGPFDLAHLPAEERDSVATSVEKWLELVRLPGGERTDANVLDRCPAILRTLGIGFDGRGSRPIQAPHARGLLFLDFKGIRRAGRAMVPALGSLLTAETLRVMFAFEETTARRLLETVKQDNSGLTCLVVYLPGVLDPEQRRAAANICRKANLLAPIVDLAVFLELLSSPESDRFERLVNLTLPFTWVNPYVPNVQGRVPAEMFYGRDREVQQVVMINGPSFVYGGRQLGKSALLRRSARAIVERERDAKGIYLDLNEHGVGLFAPPETVWSVLAEELTRAEVLTPSNAPMSFDRVAKGLEKWLDESPTRRVLILLDECDAFLERDFQNNYPVTHQIRGLMDRTGRRCKFVLAGLNLVQRFDRGTNHPMAHLASTSIEVGPLDGKAAFRLVHEPLHALGVRFENSDLSLIYKILASTNDQASLIQLVCDRLLQRVASDILGATSAGPTITSDLVRQELNDPELQAEISRRFEWTISLDGRYQSIAYRVALEARAGSPRLSADDLLLLARMDWPGAFDSMSKEEFVWYLRELSTFGVLRHHDGEWMLRSPNLIELIGSPAEIQGRIQRITSRTPEQRLDPTRLRYPRDSSGHPGPLAGDQVAAILSNAGHLTVLVASRLGGLDDATQSLRHMADSRGLAVVERDVSSGAELPDPRAARASGALPNLYIISASQLDSAQLQPVLDAATRRWGNVNATAERLLLVTRPDQIPVDCWSDDRLIVLRPWDLPALRHQFDIGNLAVSDSDLELIVDRTGGWHQLLAPAFGSGDKTTSGFLRSLDAPPATVDELLQAAGVPKLLGAPEILNALSGGQEWSEQDLLELFADEIPTGTVTTLRRLGLLVASADGLRLEPLAASLVNPKS
jgi:hypothetical protein